MATWDVDLHREVTDVAIGTIKTDQKPNAEIHYKKLFTSHLFPVCSPSLLESESIGEDYELLKQQTILRVDTWSDGWVL
jgi:DNA-binding transcriptional LysR family regulator